MPTGSPDEISNPTNIDPTKSIQPGEDQGAKPSQSFESFMKEGQGPQQGAKTEGPSPFDLAAQGKAAVTTGPSHETILGQNETVLPLFLRISKHR